MSLRRWLAIEAIIVAGKSSRGCGSVGRCDAHTAYCCLNARNGIVQVDATRCNGFVDGSDWCR